MNKIVRIKVYPEGGIDCLETNCPLKRECANHYTAGDFRSEDGLTPLLTIKSRTATAAACKGAEVPLGAMIFDSKGELVFAEER